MPVLEKLSEAGPLQISGGLAAGLKLGGLPLWSVQARGMARGEYEPTVQDALRRHAHNGGVVYDVGANVGFFSLLAAQLVGPYGTVHAFEPHPRTIAVLRENLRVNGLSWVHAHNVAVADYNGESVLSDVPERGWSHLEDRLRHPQRTGALPVSVATLDSYAGGFEPPDVIKIDTEGYERDVLDGAAAIIDAHSPVLICELHGNNDEVLAWLDRHGYRATNLDSADPIATAGPVHLVAVHP